MPRSSGNTLLEPPVIPGPDGARRGPAPRCDACWSITSNRARDNAEGIVLVLCVDVAECTQRYRHGASAESFAAGLRGEMLAVTP
jgi:hypothetical protein